MTRCECRVVVAAGPDVSAGLEGEEPSQEWLCHDVLSRRTIAGRSCGATWARCIVPLLLVQLWRVVPGSAGGWDFGVSVSADADGAGDEGAPGWTSERWRGRSGMAAANFLATWDISGTMA